MFAPVGCTSCGKPFQVPEAALGQSTRCPWCQAAVTALPIGGAVDAPPAPAPPTAEQPSRDAAEPDGPAPGGPQAAPFERTGLTAGGEPRPDAPGGPKPAPLERTRARPISAAKRAEPLSLDDGPVRPAKPLGAKAASLFNPVVIVVVAALSFAAMGLTILVRGYGSGRVQDSSWAEYTAPDGSCSVLLPAAPSEEAVEPNASGSATGGKRYLATNWFTRSAAWLAWVDLDPALVKSAAADKDQVFTASALRAELDREKSRLQGTVTKEAVVQSSSGWGHEVHMDTPHGRVIEWLILSPNGTRPRLYVYGLRATNVAHDSAVVRRMFISLKVYDAPSK